MQYLFITKTFNKLGVKESYFKLQKHIYMPTAKIILSDENKVIFSKGRNTMKILI